MNRYIISSLLLFFCLTSCVQNNGNIGDLFGLWNLKEIAQSDNINTTIPNTHFIAFQSSVVSLRLVDPHTSVAREAHGSYQRERDSIHLQITDGEQNLYESFGFEGPNTSFRLTLSKKRMLLERDEEQWTFILH